MHEIKEHRKRISRVYEIKEHKKRVNIMRRYQCGSNSGFPVSQTANTGVLL